MTHLKCVAHKGLRVRIPSQVQKAGVIVQNDGLLFLPKELVLRKNKYDPTTESFAQIGCRSMIKGNEISLLFGYYFDDGIPAIEGEIIDLFEFVQNINHV